MLAGSVRHLPLEVAAAIQWRDSVAEGLFRGRDLPSRSYLEVRYESLLSDPVRDLERVFSFFEIEGLPEAISYAERHLRRRRSSWDQRLSTAQIAAIEPVVRPMDEWLGYNWG